MKKKRRYLHFIIFFLMVFFSGAHELFAYYSLANNTIFDSMVRSDGKIIVGGMFTTFNDETRNHIAVVNNDGTLDVSFESISGMSIYGNYSMPDVYVVAEQQDGKILAGGWFDAYDGVSRRAIVRINDDGSLDTSFNVGSGFMFDGDSGRVTHILLQSDGKIIVIGVFDSYNGIPVNDVVRLNSDGSLDPSFSAGSGLDAWAYDAIMQPDGKIIIVGGFAAYDGQNCHGIVRVNVDGSRDLSFGTGTGTGVGGAIKAIAQQSDGRFLIGGFFSSFNGVGAYNAVRLNNDGTLDATFSVPFTYLESDDIVESIAIQSDGKILLGGRILPGGYSISRYNTDGSVDGTFSSGDGAWGSEWITDIETINVLLDGDIIISGDFQSYNGEHVNRIARINADGSIDDTFGSSTEESSEGIITNSVSNITDISATGNAEINFNFLDCSGWDPPGACFHEFDRYIQWGTETGNYTEFCDAGRDYSGFYSCELTGLTPSTTYYVQAYIDEIGGEGEIVDTHLGNEISFTTNSSGGMDLDSDLIQNLSLSVSENLTLNCGSSIDLDNNTLLTAGTPQTNTTTCQVITNDQDGYTLSLTNDRGTNNTLYHTTNNSTQDGQIQDKTPWSSTNPNATNWENTGLGFGILTSTATKNESWWGTANTCNDTTQLYAGIPTTDTPIMQHDTYSNTHTDTTICYKLDIPSTQISGEYTGSVTYTAAGRP